MIFSADIVLPITADPIENGAVLVEDGQIIDVGPRDEIVSRYAGDEETYYKNSLIMPGLVNLHGHVECSSFGYLAKSSAFDEWLTGIIAASSKLDREGWLAASRAGIKGYLEAGITCTADISRSGTGIQALLEAGLPAVVFVEAVAIDRKNLAEAVVSILERVKSAQSMSDTGWLRVGLSPHSPYTLSNQALTVCAQIAEQYELPLTIHLAETHDENELIARGTGALAEWIGTRLDIEAIHGGGTGKTSTEFLLEKGLLQKGMIAAHGVCLSEKDIDILKSNEVVLSVCPSSNEILNTGEPPVVKFMEQGLGFGIGTDSAASNPDMDLFVEASKIMNIANTANNMISAKEIIDKITIEAARMLSLDKYVGSIEVGKRADMVVIDRYPHHDHYAGILESASKSSIQSTILGGSIVYNRSES